MKSKTAKDLLKKVQEDYDKIADEFDISRKSYRKGFALFFPYIKNGDFVVDLGCGNGRLFDYLSKEKDIKYLGIDNSHNILEKARKNYPAEFIHGDLLEIPVESAVVDTVVSIASLHHVPSKEFRTKAVQEMYRILKKKGTLIVRVWNLFQPKYKKYIWKAFFHHIFTFGKYDLRDVFIPWGDKTSRYYHAFTPKELRRLLEREGFKVLKAIVNDNILVICKKLR